MSRVFVNLFDAKHLLYQLLWNMFSKEVEIADCMQILFRGNSLASKIMAYCFKIYGQSYLKELLQPLIVEMFEWDAHKVSYEIDPARFDLTTFYMLVCVLCATAVFCRLDNSENIEENTDNLKRLTQRFFDAIVASAERYSSCISSPDTALLH